MTNSDFIKKVVTIQAELVAPKTQWNAFAKYSYRNCEDILTAIKPLLHAQGLMLTLSDRFFETADEYFVEATATITDGESEVSASATAGVDLNKKGTDKSQAVGSASSYARKYCLNGLLLIDDQKDSDSTNKHGKTVATPKPTTTAKAELKANTEAFAKAVSALKGDFTMEQVKSKYVVTKEIELLLLNSLK